MYRAMRSNRFLLSINVLFLHFKIEILRLYNLHTRTCERPLGLPVLYSERDLHIHNYYSASIKEALTKRREGEAAGGKSLRRTEPPHYTFSLCTKQCKI
jgi:hypothetical protein